MLLNNGSCVLALAAFRCGFIEIEFIGHVVSAAQSQTVGGDIVTVCNMTMTLLTRAQIEDPMATSDAGTVFMRWLLWSMFSAHVLLASYRYRC